MNDPLIQKIQTLSYEHDLSKNLQPIIYSYIFKDQQNIVSWQSSKNTFQSTCGKFISDQELSFQCFTCGIEATHMYCKQCFKPELHRYHQCIIDRKNKGLCDCGFQSIISQNGCCSKHNCQMIINRKQEIEKIPIRLQNNITHFIESLCHVYQSLMKQIKTKAENLQISVLTLYHNAIINQDNNHINFIESHYPIIESIYILFNRAFNLHILIFKTIELLIHQSFSYQLLIQKILQNKFWKNSKYTVMEKILRYQIYIQVFQDYNNFKIDKILHQLYNDEEFKTFVFSIILKNFSKFWLINKFKTTKYDSKLEELYKQQDEPSFYERQITVLIFQFSWREYRNSTSIQNEIRGYIQPLISNLKENPELIDFVFSGKILIAETQCVSFEMQKQFFSQNQNVQDMIVTMEKLHYTSDALCSKSQLMLPQLFKRRFEYKTFGQIALDQLKEILNNNFDSFQQQDININLIKEFNYNKFTITTLINSLGQGIQMMNDSSQSNQQIILADTIHYILDQATYFSAICVSLKNLFCNQFCNEIFQKNIIKLLFYQTYLILKKTIRNNQIRSQQFNCQDLRAIKNGMVIQKLFIQYLCYLYCTTQFQNGGQFLHYLLDILEEDEQEFANLLNSLLKNSIQDYLIIKSNQIEKLKKAYQGIENNTEYSQFHRIDTCFIKLYIFLFDVQGFKRFQHKMELYTNVKDNTLEAKQLNTTLLKIKHQLFFQMIITDDDLYNICSPLLTQISFELKMTLVRIAGNYFNISNQMEYGDIMEKLKSFGILITSNFSNHILQICDVDQTTKKLKLKAEYKIFYEPSLICNQIVLNAQITERLIEQQRPESEISLGNGIIWDIEQYSKQSYRVLQHSLLKNYCHFELFFSNQVYLIDHENLVQQMRFLIYAQITYLKYHNSNLFKYYDLTYRIQLEELQEQMQQYQNKCKIKVLISLIKELNKTQIEENQQTTKLKFQAQKDKYKAKFNKIQSQNLIQNLFNQEQQKQLEISEENHCQTCKLDLRTSDSVGMLSIYVKSQSYIVDQTHKMLKDRININLDLGIQTCQHYFHDKCLTQSNKIYYLSEYQYGLNQYNSKCPICKLSALCRFPISEIDEQKFKSLNQDLILNYSLLKGNEIEEDTLVEIYINLFFDLLTSLFINPQNYRNTQKNIVFKQLLACFYKTIQQMNKDCIKILPKIKCLKKQKNLVLNTLNSICDIYKKQFNLNQLRLSIIKLVSKYRQLSKEEISLFVSSFGIEEEIALKQLNQEQNKCSQDESLEYYQTLQSKTIELVQNKLGQTFLLFHGKYFANKCSLCNFYNNKKSKDSGVSVCLLCSDLFCNQSCSISIKEHLDYHVNKKHDGNSIFVNLYDSSVTVISSSISIKKFTCLYYNHLGESINTEDPYSDWNTYILDVTKANELAWIILNNSYGKIIKKQGNQ